MKLWELMFSEAILCPMTTTEKKRMIALHDFEDAWASELIL
jgi:hypothetical protein